MPIQTKKDFPRFGEGVRIQEILHHSPKDSPGEKERVLKENYYLKYEASKLEEKRKACDTFFKHRKIGGATSLALGEQIVRKNLL